MSADLLREAAALMRERAEKASRGPWRHESNLGKVPASVVHAAPGAIRGKDRDLPVTADTFGRDGAHIASWHPAVALAVADLLDERAKLWDVNVRATQSPSRGVDDPPGIYYGNPELAEANAARHFRHALNVARNYLGRDA